MGGVCGTYGGEEKRIDGFGGETWRAHLGDLRKDGIIIFNCILKKRESVWDSVVGIQVVITIEAAGLGKHSV